MPSQREGLPPGQEPRRHYRPGNFFEETEILWKTNLEIVVFLICDCLLHEAVLDWQENIRPDWERSIRDPDEADPISNSNNIFGHSQISFTYSHRLVERSIRDPDEAGPFSNIQCSNISAKIDRKIEIDLSETQMRQGHSQIPLIYLAILIFHLYIRTDWERNLFETEMRQSHPQIPAPDPQSPTNPIEQIPSIWESDKIQLIQLNKSHQ